MNSYSILYSMQHHVTAILWQCAASPEHVYDRSDNILPLSRYITTYPTLKHGPCTVCAVCGVEIQLMYIMDQLIKMIGYFINGKHRISIGRRKYNNECEALEVYFSRGEGKWNHKTVVYAWHRDGRIKNHSVHNMYHTEYSMASTPCTQDCSIGTAIASIDAFFNNLLRFRMIRIRQK